jgi:hypothetical protein
MTSLVFHVLGEHARAYDPANHKDDGEQTEHCHAVHGYYLAR